MIDNLDKTDPLQLAYYIFQKNMKFYLESKKTSEPVSGTLFLNGSNQPLWHYEPPTKFTWEKVYMVAEKALAPFIKVVYEGDEEEGLIYNGADFTNNLYRTVLRNLAVKEIKFANCNRLSIHCKINNSSDELKINLKLQNELLFFYGLLLERAKHIKEENIMYFKFWSDKND